MHRRDTLWVPSPVFGDYHLPVDPLYAGVLPTASLLTYKISFTVAILQLAGYL